MIRNDLLPKTKTWLFASFNEARGILLHSFELGEPKRGKHFSLKTEQVS